MILNTICKDIYRGYQVSSNEIKQYSENINGREEYQIVNITNITDGNIDSDLTKIYPDTDKMDKYLLQDKDLLVSSKGTLSKFAVVEIKNNEKYIPSGNFTILRLDTNSINPYYLKIFFESNKGTAIINSIKSGGVLPAINLSQFKEINVPVPSIEEQNRIVNRYLAKTDEIKMIKNKLNKLKENLGNIEIKRDSTQEMKTLITDILNNNFHGQKIIKNIFQRRIIKAFPNFDIKKFITINNDKVKNIKELFIKK